MGFFPALDIRPPASPTEQIGSALQIRNAMQAGVAQQIANTEGIIQLHDQAAMTKAMQGWNPQDGSDALIGNFIRQGGSGAGAFKLSESLLGRQKMLSDIAAQDATTDSKNLETLKSKNDTIAGRLQSVLSLPDAQLSAGLTNAASELKQQGVLDPIHMQGVAQIAGLPPDQIRAQLGIFEKGLLGMDAQVNQAKADAETKLAQSNALLNQKKADLYNLPSQQWVAGIDSMIDPAKYPEINKRVKAQVTFDVNRGDPDAAKSDIDSATADMARIEFATDPRVIGADVAKERALDIGNNPYIQNVAPAMAGQAIGAYRDTSEKFADVMSANRDMQTFFKDAEAGNKFTYSYAPTLGVLTINSQHGSVRVNTYELESFGGAGSAMDRVNGFFGKQLSGASIPDDVLGDMETAFTQLGQNAGKAYSDKVNIINQTYNSTFRPMNLGAPGSGAAYTSSTKANAPVGMFAVKAPNGKTYTFKTQADAEAFKKEAGIP